MIALSALKVAVVAYAATATTWLALRVRVAALDAREQRIGALSNEYIMRKYPSILAIALACGATRLVAVIATIVAAIAWAVGA